MKHFLKKAFELSGYTPIRIEVLRDPQKQNPITRVDFYNLYFSKLDPDDFFFVQIGANDGKSQDPLYPYITAYGLKGLVIEPQPDVFAKLQKTYEDFPQVTCVNAAIGAISGMIPFYCVKESVKMPENFFPMTRIASFNRNSVKRGLRKKISLGADPEEYIETTIVKTMTFPELLQQYGVKKVDFLQTDCEGYDFELLKAVDLETLLPEVLNCETCLFSDAEREAYEARLANLGYKFFRSSVDTCAYRVRT